MDLDPARERRIAYEIVVDAYDEHEVAMGWRTYLEDHLTFPFEAQYIPNSSAQPVRVTVTELEDFDEDSDEDSDDFDDEDESIPDLEFSVTMRWDEDEFSAALEHIFPIHTDESTLEAVLDWHYWKVHRG